MALCEISANALLLKMDQIDDSLKLLNTLMHSTIDEMVEISKSTLMDIKICLQNAHEKIEFLQLESQLQQEELKQKSHHSEPVSIQNIEKDSHQQQEYKVVDDSHSVPCTREYLHADAVAQSALPKPIVRPWENLVHNKHKIVLGYDKELSFHIPNYSVSHQ